MPAVDDRRLPGVGAQEEEEVVADQLHLVEGLVDVHRGGRVVLLAHDPAGEVLIEVGDVRPLRELPVAVEGLGDTGVGGAGAHPHAGRGPSSVVDAAAVGGLAQPVVELAGGQVQRRVEVRRSGLGPDHRPLAAERDLHALALAGLAWVLLVEELHVDAQDLEFPVEPVETADLVLDVLSVVLGDFDVPATDHDLHETSRSFGL